MLSNIIKKIYKIYLIIIIFALYIFIMPIYSYAKSRVKPMQTEISESHCFFEFDKAPYHTSKDQRIGVKILIDPAKVGPTLASLQHITFLPGAHIKSHRHVYVTEIIYVIKGNLTLRIGNITKVLGPETVAYIPPQVFHEYKNETSDICQFLQYFSPSGPEEEYRLWQRVGDTNLNNASPSNLSENNDKTKVIQGKPMPVIPGSPATKIQKIAEITSSSENINDNKLFSNPNEILSNNNLTVNQKDSNTKHTQTNKSRIIKDSNFFENNINTSTFKLKTKLDLLEKN